eukprot:TRINITY_DN2061_c0_g1_i1.p1 TRINITY_DN2061_c0_g1~~TRINITY_DN2061_c0_g1_i1.p1  ORF type:complete len:624 (-),score=160.71 TRINITY_DN2061_c0_g1_i1:156-2027(-)
MNDIEGYSDSGYPIPKNTNKEEEMDSSSSSEDEVIVEPNPQRRMSVQQFRRASRCGLLVYDPNDGTNLPMREVRRSSSPMADSLIAQLGDSRGDRRSSLDMLMDKLSMDPDFLARDEAEKKFILKCESEKDLMDLEMKNSEIMVDICFPHHDYYRLYRATYMNVPIMVKEFVSTNRVADQEVLKLEAKRLRNLRHVNIVMFIGFTLNPNSLVFEYLNQGSLAGLIVNPSVRFIHNNIFTCISEISKGMSYLHSQSPPVLFKNLCSEAVVVSDNWQKIKLRLDHKEDRMIRAWEASIAPTDLSDVYTFGIIVWELVTRKRAVYHATEQHFKLPKSLRRFFGEYQRKWVVPIPEGCPPFIEQLLEACWQDDPRDRPTFGEINSFLHKMEKWFANERSDLGYVLDRDIQYIIHPPPNPHSADKVRYCRCVTTIGTEQESEIFLKHGSIAWTSESGGKEIGSLLLYTYFGQFIHCSLFDSIEELRKSAFRQRDPDFVRNFNKTGSFKFNWRLLEFVAWDVQIDAKYCTVQRINIHENTEDHIRAVVKHHAHVISHLPYSKGVMFLYDPQAFMVTLLHFLDKEESEDQLQKDGVIGNLLMMLFSADSRITAGGSLEGYHLGKLWFRES